MGRVWLVTGCSSGLGLEIARDARAHGETVIATSRGDAAQRLAQLVAAGCEAVSLDVTWPADQVQRVIADILARHGRLDVLVNNAGMVQQGSVEETTEKETYDQFYVNFFGLLNLTRLVLPHMRTQRSGVIVNIGSRGGRHADPALGLYNATKFALEGITEALAQEVASFGISATCIEPGNFRTAVFEPSNTRLPANPIPAYDHLRERFGNISGTQIGDPVRGAREVVALVMGPQKIPVRLALGSDSAESLKTAYQGALDNLREWDEVTRRTDYDV